MQDSFNRIKQEYNRRRGILLLKGQSQRATSHGYWATSDPDQIYELFRKLDLKRFRSFADLGSGDGIIAAIASLFTEAEGIEIDPELHRAAEEMKKTLHLSHTLLNADYLDHDLSRYDVIFINPDNYFHRLEKKIVDEFKGTLIITDNIFRPLTLSPQKKVSVRGESFSIYTLNT